MLLCLTTGCPVAKKSSSVKSTVVPLAPAIREGSSGLDLPATVQGLVSSPCVESFNVSVNKKTGVTSLTVNSADGSTTTQQALSPGLIQSTSYTPSKPASRDAAVAALHNNGLTQTQSARALNVSQATVSNVQRRLGLR